MREDELGAALAVVRAAAASTGVLTLDLGPVETFLPVNPVVFLAVGGPSLPTVHALQAALLDGPLARPPTHEFVPHVTVAENLAEERIPEAMSALSGYRHTIVKIRHLHVLEEVRDEEDRRVWRPLAGVAFGPPSVVGRGGLETVIEVHDRVPPDAGALGAERGPGRRRAWWPGGPRWSWACWVGGCEGPRPGWSGSRWTPVSRARVSAPNCWRPTSRWRPTGAPSGCTPGPTPGARAESFLAGRGWAREDPPPMVRGRIGPVG